MKDHELYCRFKNGDDDGLRGLLDRYGDSLTLYITGYIHDPHDAEDIMIELFAYLVAKRPSIRENGVKAYLFKAARNAALRYCAKSRRLRCFGFEDIGTEPESEQLIDSVIRTHERNRLLHLCMARLHHDYREALYLVYFEELTYAQTAAVMGKNEKQIDNLVQRGKKAMKNLLAEEGITDAQY